MVYGFGISAGETVSESHFVAAPQSPIKRQELIQTKRLTLARPEHYMHVLRLPPYVSFQEPQRGFGPQRTRTPLASAGRRASILRRWLHRLERRATPSLRRCVP